MRSMNQLSTEIQQHIKAVSGYSRQLAFDSLASLSGKYCRQPNNPDHRWIRNRKAALEFVIETKWRFQQ